MGRQVSENHLKQTAENPSVKIYPTMKRDTNTADSETDTTRKGSVLPLTGKSKPNNLKQ